MKRLLPHRLHLALAAAGLCCLLAVLGWPGEPPAGPARRDPARPIPIRQHVVANSHDWVAPESVRTPPWTTQTKPSPPGTLRRDASGKVLAQPGPTQSPAVYHPRR